MPLFGKLKNIFTSGPTESGDGKKKLKYPLIKQDADPNELWLNVGELGDGAFGKVYKAEHKNEKYFAALKQVDISNEDDLEEYSVEIDILHQCKHKNVVGIFESYLTQDKLWMYIEFCELGALDGIMLELDRPLTEPQIQYICKEMCEGLEFLHSKLVIHRDLKAGNILLTSSGDVRLADFGVSAKNTSLKQKRDSFIGTPYWMAPEVILCETIKDAPYDYKADIWSFGITLIECSQINPPYHEMHPMRVVLKIQKATPPSLTYPHKWSKEFNDFLTKCLQKDPESRLSATDLLQHPFVTNVQGKEGIEDLVSELRADVTCEEKDIDEDLENLHENDSGGHNKSSDDDSSLKLEEKSSEESNTSLEAATDTSTQVNKGDTSTTTSSALSTTTNTTLSVSSDVTFDSGTNDKSFNETETPVPTSIPPTTSDNTSITNIADAPTKDKLHGSNTTTTAENKAESGVKTVEKEDEFDKSLLRTKKTTGKPQTDIEEGENKTKKLDAIQEEDAKPKPKHSKKTMTKTRVFMVNGEIKTSQVHKVIGANDKNLGEHKLWKADLRELKQLHRQENRQLQEMEKKSVQAIEEQDKKFEQDIMSMRSQFDGQLDSMSKQHKSAIDKMLNNHISEKKHLLKKIKSEQDKDNKLLVEGLKQELKLMKKEVDMLPKEARKEAYVERKNQKELQHTAKCKSHQEKQQEESERVRGKLEEQHSQQISLAEKQFLQQKQQVIRERELAAWHLEERHMNERLQLLEQQLQKKFVLKKNHMIARHAKETEQIRRINFSKVDELFASQLIEKKRLPKIMKDVRTTRTMMYRESIRISMCNITLDEEKEKLKNFQDHEKHREDEEKKRLEQKHTKQMKELKVKNNHLLEELEQVHSDKQKMLEENETQKIAELKSGFTRQIEQWKEQLEPRKKQLDALFEAQLAEQLSYLDKGDYASASNITASSSCTPLLSRRHPLFSHLDDEDNELMMKQSKRGSGVFGVLKLRDSFRSSSNAGIRHYGAGFVANDFKKPVDHLVGGREVLILKQEDFTGTKAGYHEDKMSEKKNVSEEKEVCTQTKNESDKQAITKDTKEESFSETAVKDSGKKEKFEEADQQKNVGINENLENITHEQMKIADNEKIDKIDSQQKSSNICESTIEDKIPVDERYKNVTTSMKNENPAQHEENIKQAVKEQPKIEITTNIKTKNTEDENSRAIQDTTKLELSQSEKISVNLEKNNQGEIEQKNMPCEKANEDTVKIGENIRESCQELHFDKPSESNNILHTEKIGNLTNVENDGNENIVKEQKENIETEAMITSPLEDTQISENISDDSTINDQVIEEDEQHKNLAFHQIEETNVKFIEGNQLLENDDQFKNNILCNDVLKQSKVEIKRDETTEDKTDSFHQKSFVSKEDGGQDNTATPDKHNEKLLAESQQIVKDCAFETNGSQSNDTCVDDLARGDVGGGKHLLDDVKDISNRNENHGGDKEVEKHEEDDDNSNLAYDDDDILDGMTWDNEENLENNFPTSTQLHSNSNFEANKHDQILFENNRSAIDEENEESIHKKVALEVSKKIISNVINEVQSELSKGDLVIEKNPNEIETSDTTESLQNNSDSNNGTLDSIPLKTQTSSKITTPQSDSGFSQISTPDDSHIAVLPKTVSNENVNSLTDDEGIHPPENIPSEAIKLEKNDVETFENKQNAYENIEGSTDENTPKNNGDHKG